MIESKEATNAMPAPPPPGRRWLSLREMAGMAGLSRSSLVRMRQDPTFPKPRILGGVRRWSLLEVVDFIDAQAKSEEQFHPRQGGRRRRREAAVGSYRAASSAPQA